MVSNSGIKVVLFTDKSDIRRGKLKSKCQPVCLAYLYTDTPNEHTQRRNYSYIYEFNYNRVCKGLNF